MDYKAHGKACTFCDTGAIYKDGKETTTGPYACGNHAMRLNDPRTVDPVSPAMARQMAEMLATPDGDEYNGDDEN